MTNCVNCGAPLHDNKCPYCGTEYDNGEIVADFGDGDYTGKITVGGRTYNVYLGRMTAMPVYDDEGRHYNGRFVFEGKLQKVKHTFTLVEI